MYILRKPDGQQVYPLGIPKYLRLFSFFKAINYYLVKKNPYTEFELLKKLMFLYFNIQSSFSEGDK